MILDRFFQLMAEKKASDLFISVGTPIHIKIQGSTFPVNAQIIEAEIAEKIAFELMTAEQLKVFESTLEMNLAFGVPRMGNFRINIFRQRGFIAIAIRYILIDIPPLNSLMLPPVLADLIMQKRGLIIVAGATGAGKSTTLAAMLDHRNEHSSGHILTIEDPIEFLFKHKKSIVNQRELGIDTLDWEPALKNAMRQAPDCILIGEIRDQKTMHSAIAYAQSGHLCLGTLHGNNSYQALNRIINFFPLERRSSLLPELAASIKAIISQRLVRKVDGKLAPTVEILLNTRHIQELIERGDLLAIKEAMEKSMAQGSQTFEQDLFRLQQEGLISVEEALANADSPTDLAWLINNKPQAPQADKYSHSKQQERAASPPPESSTDLSSASFTEFKLTLEDNNSEKP